jgi:hypothetical protein
MEPDAMRTEPGEQGKIGLAYGSLNLDRTYTFRCLCDELLTIPSYGDESTAHACGRAWWWSNVGFLSWEGR